MNTSANWSSFTGDKVVSEGVLVGVDIGNVSVSQVGELGKSTDESVSMFQSNLVSMKAQLLTR